MSGEEQRRAAWILDEPCRSARSPPLRRRRCWPSADAMSGGSKFGPSAGSACTN